MKFAVFAALVAIALPVPAFAADWVLVSESSDGGKLYIDRQSIRAMPNGYKRAWNRAHFAKPDRAGNTGFRTFDEFDCTGGRSRRLQWTLFKEEEILSTDSGPAEWKFVAPETIAEAQLNFICEN